MKPEVTVERRPLAFELALVVLVAAAVLVPGLWRYSLVDPWETHYGEVAREMMQNQDLVRTTWAGASLSGNLDENEGFRSKPVLSFWLMAASFELTGVARDGGYSGELTESPATMLAVRLPFVLTAIGGLTLVWWMLARLINRRLAWLALLVVGTCPFFCLVARQAIPDMPLVACTMGALALFIMATEDGARPVSHVATFGRWRIDARHVVLGLAGAFVLLQAVYFAVYFLRAPDLALRGRMLTPALWLPALMLLLFGALARDGWLILRLPFVLIGGVIAAIVNEPLPHRRAGQGWWRALVDNTLVPWERHALDRYLVRAVVAPTLWVMRTPSVWRATALVADRVLRMAPITTMRQLYLLGCYALLGVSVLAKGPPGLAVVGGVGVFYVLLLGRWRELYEGGFEIKRGLVMMIVVFLPWHIAMFLKDGPAFINEYLFTHILNRAAVGVDNSPGTFESYTSQLGHGMWLWAALVPAALGTLVTRVHLDTRAGRVRFVVGLWAIVGMAFFCVVQTKFHHYILPVVPALAVLVAFFLDDLAARRERLHPVYAALGAGIVLLICRDLMAEPDRWIEMFVFLYNRPWPGGEPWNVDPSNGFLVLGLLGVLALAIAATRFVRAGVASLAAVGLAIAIWALQAYMPVAGTHWGMGDAMRTYYEQRTIYGQRLVYFSAAQVRADWQDIGDEWSFESMLPDAIQVGQPMTIALELHKAKDEKAVEQKLELVGTVTSLGAHRITVTLLPGERAKVDPLIAAGANAPAARRPALRLVAADPLIAYQLYWRGEQFWSAGEIWGWLLETKTSFPNTNNVELGKYLNDRSRSPLGPRYFVIGPQGALQGIRSTLPTPRAKSTFEVLDQTSNKFSLGAFEL